MRNLPDVAPDFDAATAAACAYSMTDELRRGMRAGIGKTVHGWHPSTKVGTVEFMGTGQSDAMSVLDLRADVSVYVTWPLEVRFSDGGRTGNWVPDLGIRFADGRRAALDVLSRDEAAFFRKHRLAEMLERALLERNVAYVAREHSAFTSSRPCRNAAFARRFRVAAVEEPLATRIEDCLAAGGSKNLAKVRDEMASFEGVVATACAMAWRGRLTLDLEASEPLGMTLRLAGVGR